MSETTKKKSDGVTIPEDFQRKVNELVDCCTTKEALSYMEECARNKRYEMDKPEAEMSDEGMPED